MQEQHVTRTVSESILLIGSLCGGTWATIYGANLVIQARSTVDWPTAPGVVESSKVESDWTVGRSRRQVYYPRIVYTYEVDGELYKSTKIRIGLESFRQQSTAEKYVTQYPKDRQLRVAFEPGNPTNTVLEIGYDKSTFGWLVTGIGFILLPLWVWLLLYLQS